MTVLSRLAAGALAPLLLVALASGAAAAEEKPAPFTPQLRIPKLAKPPVIDGKIGKDEWSGAAAVTGFTNLGGSNMSLPDFLQPVWYIAYDDTNFYLAFRYPVHPKGSLRAKCKTKTAAESQIFGENILTDDHTEIEICTTGREKAVSGYFYKFMTNPWDAIADQKVRWSIGQQGMEYDTAAVAKSTFTDDCWEQELAIPLKDLGVLGLKDGDAWVVQLVSAQDPGSNYYTWVPATWLAFHAFPEVIFDSKAVAVQFVDVGDWMKGNPAFKFRFSNPHPADAKLGVAVKIVNSAGETVLDEKRAVALKAGENREETVAATGLKLGDLVQKDNVTRDNMVTLEITDAASGAVYYRHRMPLRKFETADVQAYIKNLDQARKPPAPKLEFAYMPSYNRLKVSADVGILGIDPKLGKEARRLVAWYGPVDKKLLGRRETPFAADGTASVLFELRPLEEGQYRIDIAIQDAAGNALVTKKDTFERKVFPFESFKGGTTDIVLPPYTAVKAEGRTFQTVGTRWELAPTGLPTRVENTLIPEEAGRSLLAAPVRLQATRGNKTELLAAKGQGFAWAPGVDARVRGEGSSDLAGLAVKLVAEADYTGQYLVDAYLTPDGKVDLDRLELVIPVSDPVDTAFAYSPRDSVMLYGKEHPYTGTPKEGVLWTNLSGESVRPHIMYVGNGERGLYWYTDSYEGFWIDKAQPHIVLEKEKSATLLRIALINKPVTLDHARHLRFALLAAPTKPLPADYRTKEWSERMHIGATGWWGTTGCFVMPLGDPEWHDWIAGKPFMYKGKPYPGQFPLTPTPRRDQDGRWLLRNGQEYGVYRAADIIGYLQPELKVFAGEWADVTNPPVMPDASLLSYKDDKGQSIWPEPEQRAVYGKDACVPSFYDYEAYYFYLAARNAGVGGCWWDWGSFVEGRSLDKGTMYLNDEGRPEPRTSLFLVRNFYQRVARIVHEAGVPDTNNCYAPGAVFQMPWLNRMNAWESMYLESALDDMFDAQGVDKYRSIIGKFAGVPVRLVMNIDIDLKDHRGRSVLALALLHDSGICGVNGKHPARAVLDKAGLFDPAAEWVPYWRSAAVAAAEKPSLMISAYKAPKRLILVVVNPDKAAVESDIVLKGPSSSARDAETDQAVPFAGGRLTGVKVGGHDFRLVIVE